MVNNPYGQFVSVLCRGKEFRNLLDMHVSDHYAQLQEVVLDGVSLIVDGKEKRFYVVVLLVANLSFLKEVIGQCQCTSMYGLIPL